MKMYKVLSLTLMLLFAVTGILFLSVPDRIIDFFNTLAASFGLPQSPVSGWNFYLILAAGYMYLVTVLAFLMFKRPENRYFPLLLIHAKSASALLSLAFFLFQAPHLIYLANFAIDAAIGILVVVLYGLMMRKTEWACS